MNKRCRLLNMKTESRRFPTAVACVLLAAILVAGMNPPSSLANESVGTFSIVAYDPATKELGVAVQSRVFGVGRRVAWVKGGVGAIATQAHSNETFGPRGLELMAAGLSAGETLEVLLAHDEGRDQRQVGIVDAQGEVANWTGPGCMFWAGDSTGTSFTCQGNILVSAQVVADMVGAFYAHADQELARRLIAALEAAQAAGGDSRGQQSASILIGRVHPDYPEYSERYVDIRVEDHETPIAELMRLYEMYEAQGLVQAHMRFAQWLETEGDSTAARAEKLHVGDAMVRALAKDGADAGMLNNLAWFCTINDIYLDQALIAAQRAVALEPENSNVLDTLAEVHFRLGDVDKAIEVEERALELSPDNEYLAEQLARFRGESH